MGVESIAFNQMRKALNQAGYLPRGKRSYTNQGDSQSPIGGLESDVREGHGPLGGQLYGDNLQGYGGFSNYGAGADSTRSAAQGAIDKNLRLIGDLNERFTGINTGGYSGGKDTLVSGSISNLSGVFSELQDRDLAFATVGGTSGTLTSSESALPGGGVSRSYRYDIKEDVAGDRQNLRAAIKMEMSKRSAYLESFFRN